MGEASSPKLPRRLVITTLLCLLALEILLRPLALLRPRLLPRYVALPVALDAAAHGPAEKALLVADLLLIDPSLVDKRKPKLRKQD